MVSNKIKILQSISNYIKIRLGVLRGENEYSLVKMRIFIVLGINKWDELDVTKIDEILPVIDESIRIIKLDRPQQIGMWD